MAFESWIDRQIREAMERGEFDNLPGAGKPLRDLARDGDDWWITAKLEREGFEPPLPGTLALRKERSEIQQTLADVTDEDQARELVQALNRRIRESYLSQEKPFVHVPTLDVEAVVAQWRQRRP